MLQLLDLPPEILREIFLYSVAARGLVRGLRLRLVNRFFSHEITQTLLVSPITDEYIVEHQQWYRIERYRGPEYDAFWQAYLTNRVLSQKGPLAPLPLRFVRKVAEHLCTVTGDQDVRTLRKYVHELMSMNYWPWRLLTSTDHFLDSEPPSWDQPRFLLRAAIITDCSGSIEEIINGPDKVAALSPCDAFEPWQSAAYLAAERGNTDLLEKAFIESCLDTRELREAAFSAAVREGNLPLVEFILEPRFGPPDFFSSSLCVEENLLQGMLKSSSVDFFARLFDLLASRSSSKYPIEIHPPDMDRVLDDVAYYRPQRNDVAEWLFDHAAATKVDEKEAPSDEAHRRWNQLCRAVKGGNEKIVQLLLERGPEPEAKGGVDSYKLYRTLGYSRNDDMLLQAVKPGRFDIVRILTEHGAKAKAHPGENKPSYLDPAKSPHILNQAILSENKSLCKFLIDHGAEIHDSTVAAAINEGLESMAHFLLEQGGGTHATTEMIDKAKRLGWHEIVSMLQRSARTARTDDWMAKHS
ncbi:hypothetical protein N0V83_005760 [Neocucurbitaria cava]|uniref:Uncharacterized protein n=1 Tax=Neocucurbitaria cava TaxID=798079 RepID=A0A9W8Y8G3_9PLEO|nr:hypothetical protein N0V83_005760 [Neocucurbitaria cava]